jgi:hypothetical protein
MVRNCAIGGDMPLTKKGAKIKKSMESQYGKKRGSSIFYASQNKGTIKGIHKGKKR